MRAVFISSVTKGCGGERKEEEGRGREVSRKLFSSSHDSSFTLLMTETSVMTSIMMSKSSEAILMGESQYKSCVGLSQRSMNCHSTPILSQLAKHCI
jgi:hypothetical protein